jgi:hypothetical protein
MDANNNQKGQALIELILFLPFMLMMYTVVVSLGDSIYASINQQKITRAYFYYRMQNNSQISKPQRNDGGGLINSTWTQFGHFFIGWADYLNSDSPVAPCFKLNLPFAPGAGDSCDTSYTNLTTQFVRVATVYGVCGATIGKGTESPGDFVELPGGMAGSGSSILDTILDASNCLISQ